jgi:predicted RNA binding protein YcfA (HicA-like mRNA interferase family)
MAPQSASHCSRLFLARGYFYPEDGGDKFLRNVGSHKIYMAPQSASHLLTLVPSLRIFYPEDGGDTFLRNVGSHKIYTAPHPRRRHSTFLYDSYHIIYISASPFFSFNRNILSISFEFHLEEIFSITNGLRSFRDVSSERYYMIEAVYMYISYAYELMA